MERRSEDPEGKSYWGCKQSFEFTPYKSWKACTPEIFYASTVQRGGPGSGRRIQTWKYKATNSGLAIGLPGCTQSYEDDPEFNDLQPRSDRKC